MKINSNKKYKAVNSYDKAVDILKDIKPKLRLNGESFSEWHRKAYDKLYELLGLDMFEKCDSNLNIEKTEQMDGYKRVRFTFESEKNYVIPCYMLIPDNAVKPMKTVICLQGHSSGMNISVGISIFDGDEEDIKSGDRDFAIRAVKEGFCAIAMDQRYMGECGGIENKPGCIKGKDLATLLMGRCAVGERVWDVSRLIDLLTEQFNDIVDKNNIICLGNSGGGTTTFYAACIDSRIKCAVPSCSVCTYQDSIIELGHCSCNYIPQIAKYFDMGDLAGLIAPRGLIIVNGIEDTIFPKKGVQKTVEIAYKYYDLCCASEKLKNITGNGGHRFYADDTWPVIHELVK